MSDEINLSFSFTCANGFFLDQVSSTLVIDQATIGAGQEVQSVMTSTGSPATTVLSLAGVTTNGIAILQNLDDTNYVIWGPSSTGTSTGTMVACGKLKPGEQYAVRIAPGVVLMGQANTAPCQVLTKIYDD